MKVVASAYWESLEVSLPKKHFDHLVIQGQNQTIQNLRDI